MKPRSHVPTTNVDIPTALNESFDRRVCGGREFRFGVPDMAQKSLDFAQALEATIPLPELYRFYAGLDAVALLEAMTTKDLGEEGLRMIERSYQSFRRGGAA